MNLDSPDVFVGVDVSGARLDVHVLPDRQCFDAANDGRGIARLVVRLGGMGRVLVVVEATGGLEWRLVTALHDAGLAVAVVNPRVVRDFARGAGLLAKTDRLDAYSPRVLRRAHTALATAAAVASRYGAGGAGGAGAAAQAARRPTGSRAQPRPA